MSDDIEIVWVEPIMTAVIRDVVRPRDLTRFVPAACAAVVSISRAGGQLSPGRILARYRENGTTEAGVEVLGGSMADPRLCRSHLPAGWVAHAAHRGTYDRLVDTHHAIQRWCAALGHRGGGERWEIFAPWQERWDADPAAIRTDVYHLLGPDHQGPPPPWAWRIPRGGSFGAVPMAGTGGRRPCVIESVHIRG